MSRFGRRSVLDYLAIGLAPTCRPASDCAHNERRELPICHSDLALPNVFADVGSGLADWNNSAELAVNFNANVRCWHGYPQEFLELIKFLEPGFRTVEHVRPLVVHRIECGKVGTRKRLEEARVQDGSTFAFSGRRSLLLQRRVGQLAAVGAIATTT